MTTEEKPRLWQVTCVCGWRVHGTREEVVAAVQEHGRTAHGIDSTEEQVMSQAVPWQEGEAAE